MKRTFLKKQGKNPRRIILKKADSALQDWYRKNYGNEKCECCGAKMQLMHHHIEKSKSNYLRFNHPENLIFMCRACHNAIHFGGHQKVSIYTLGRGGKKWVDKIHKLERISISLSIQDSKDIIQKYGKAETL
jgi:hypothetical protein